MFWRLESDGVVVAKRGTLKYRLMKRAERYLYGKQNLTIALKATKKLRTVPLTKGQAEIIGGPTRRPETPETVVARKPVWRRLADALDKAIGWLASHRDKAVPATATE